MAAAVAAGALKHEAVANLERVRGLVSAASKKLQLKAEPRLVAVSKKHDHVAVRAAYDVGQRNFGENYVQELVQKAPLLPLDTKWHFIGNLQSGKCATLLKSVPNLYVLETVDRIKLADKLNAAVLQHRLGGERQLPDADGRPAEAQGLPEWARGPLKVMVQVNTSDEASKSGCSPDESPDIAEHIVAKCKALEFIGLMTIGRFDDPPTDDCFQTLVACKEKVLERLAARQLPAPEHFELSMGMSHDMELALKCGSTNLRVGTAIFGAR